MHTPDISDQRIAHAQQLHHAGILTNTQMIRWWQHDIRGKSIAQIAHDSDVSISSVKESIREARRKLRRHQEAA